MIGAIRPYCEEVYERIEVLHTGAIIIHRYPCAWAKDHNSLHASEPINGVRVEWAVVTHVGS